MDLIRNISKGFGQRTGLAQALLGAPEVLVLDEPTSVFVSPFVTDQLRRDKSP